ncbi:LIC_13387 family protein [Sorangium sp. So ce1151]|uniref:LIC_13387 family protein n=1 Tax=Sorangium sp. So ce1151 TaxID=3133332 RepID=UPI003F5D9720
MSSRAQVLFQVGAWAWVVTGVGHLAITALLLGRPAPPAAEKAVLEAMRAHRTSMMGLSRDLLGLHVGFSVAMGLVLALHGAVGVLAAPALAARPAVVALNAAVSLALLAISARAFPPPPIATMLVATASFSAALVVR